MANVTLDWRATDKLVVCRVISSRGVAHRNTPVFSDRVGHGSFVPSSAIVTGVVVEENADTRYLRCTNGHFLPMDRPSKGEQRGESLIMELPPDDSTVIVADCGEPSVCGAYEALGLLDGAVVYRLTAPDAPHGHAHVHMFRTGCSGAFRWTMASMTPYVAASEFRTKNVEKVFYRCNKTDSESPPCSGWLADAYDSGAPPAPAVYSVSKLQESFTACSSAMAGVQTQVTELEICGYMCLTVLVVGANRAFACSTSVLWSDSTACR